MHKAINKESAFRLFARLTLAVLAGCCAAPGAQAADNARVVHTSSGAVRGVARPGGGAEFLGIPYAQPPVGALRWHPPVPVAPWKGVRDASTFGAPCAQPVLGGWNRHDAERSQENCLYLNVITPQWPASKPLPVMFWIHGGANVGGTASSDLYKDGTLPAHGVVLVTINYRLGVFGFFAHPALTRESEHRSSGNYGLMDQILALQWVRRNIARFGGDPKNITVFGQSAGSMDTGMLMASPLAAGLFQKAIAESGSPFQPPLASLAEAEQAGAELAASLDAPSGEDTIAFLRDIPAAELIKKMEALQGEHRPRIGPDVDGWVLPRSPAQVFAAGQEAAVPLLIGTTTREFGSSASADQLRKTIQREAGDLAPQALALYGLAGNGQGSADPFYGTAADQWSADTEFHCPIATEALWHSKAGFSTYQYQFEHAIPGQEAQGAVHSSDLPYVFGYFPTAGNIAGQFGPVDLRLADTMETYWTNFARTGNPNGGSLPRWPALKDAQRYMEFTEEGKAVVSDKPLRAAQCGLYRQMLSERLK